MEDLTVTLAEAIQSDQYIQVRRRIFRQLIESLIYEGVIFPDIETDQDGQVFLINGKDQKGRPVQYRCRGFQRFTFGRIRLSDTPVERRSDRQRTEAQSLSQFLLDIQYSLQADEDKIAAFANELERTLFHDTHAQYTRQHRNIHVRNAEYDEWESEVMDGHTYHPSYKSRIGFSFEDNWRYGPEFKQAIQPLWVAAHKSEIKQSISARQSYRDFLLEELGAGRLSAFEARLREMGVSAEEYVFLPVHPWQWNNIITTSFLKDLREKRVIFLGTSGDYYRSQQSIRTLANVTSPAKYYLKLAMSLVNTSTGRILAPHTVQNAAVISDWLKEMVEEDEFLLKEARVALLGETIGICYDPPSLSASARSSTYGVLSCIWRESVHSFLEPGEEAVPFSALSALDVDGRPFIQEWVTEYGAESWLRRLFEASILPVVHFLYAHGVALETHAQNMILIHEKGMPRRVALKDFHDGIRFSKKHLMHPQKAPCLQQTPDYHARVNRNSFLETDDIAAVRDFMHDALFFINIGELAIFMADHFGYDERKFWALVRTVLETHQQRFPQLAERYQLFNLFAPTVQVEQLTKRRLYPDTEIRVHQVSNPLGTS